MTPRIRLVELHARDDDAADFWRAKTPEERVAAVEFLRLQCVYASGKTEMPRLERVITIIDRRPRATGDVGALGD